MPFPVKIQPVDEFQTKFDQPVTKPVLLKSRFKRLFERQFSRNSEKFETLKREGSDEFEPSSLCLTRMVQNYIEEINEKPSQKCGKNRCNCFNGNGTDSSDDEFELYNSNVDACEVLKSLVPCSSVYERNLLACVAKIVEKNKNGKRTDGICRKNVADGLIALGYNASVCKSEWEKSASFPAGVYEYVDVVVSEEDRWIIDIDFRSEFEIARSSKAYKQVLQMLPNIFVGKADRLESLVCIVSEAAKQSLKKRGMPIPPWRKAEYVKAKWLSPFTRTSVISTDNSNKEKLTVAKGSSYENELGLLFGDGNSANGNLISSETSNTSNVKEWELPQIKPKSLLKGVKVVTGLTSVIQDSN